ncbi:hypothetical protein [Arthrobacter sp. DR-2P]|nr:hypothetical protein [Arthrobacter sp. DR-2P]
MGIRTQNLANKGKAPAFTDPLTVSRENLANTTWRPASTRPPSRQPMFTAARSRRP